MIKPVFYKRSYIFFIVFLISVMLFFLYNCKQKDDIFPENVEIGEKSIDSAEIDSPAVVVFYVGNCYWFNVDSWALLEIGQVLEEQDIIKVDKDSYLEIQIGDRALISIQENTEVILDKLVYKLDKKEMRLYLKKGSVFNSLKKLMYNEDFELETPKVILSIRGTQFLVKENADETVIAVKEGRVALLPPGLVKHTGFYPTDAYSKAIDQVTASLYKQAPVIGNSNEIIITSDQAEKMKKEYEPILSLINTGEQGKSDITKSVILEQGKKLSDSLLELKDKIKDWTDKRKEEIESLKQGSMINFTRDTSGNLINLDSEDITIVEIEADSSQALVFMNDILIGKKRFGALYNSGEKVNYAVKCAGYKDTVFDVETEAGIHYSYNVRLLKKKESLEAGNIIEEQPGTPENMKSATDEPDEEKSRVETVVTIKTDPQDADIYIYGRLAGKGTYTGRFHKGDELTVLCKHDNYFDETLNVKIEEWGVKEIHTINLISKSDTEKRFDVSNTEIIGQIVYKNNTFYIADKYGSLFAVTIYGKTIWQISTNNNPNEHSFPVIIGSRIYFSGSDELIILDADKGTLLARKSLLPDEAHYFGRRLIPCEGNGIYPANNSLKIMDLKTGDISREISCPGGSRMTPVFFNDRIYIVNQKGILLRINPENGVVEKQTLTKAQMPVSLSMTVYGSYFYFGDNTGHIVCYDSNSDKVLWERDIPGEKAAVYHNLECGRESINIFVRGNLYSLDLNHGKERFPVIKNLTCPPLYYNNMLIFGTTNGFLIFCNERDGKEISRINVEQKITTRPVLINNKLIIGTEAGNVFVINPD